jgi:hypothetical protein
MTLNHSFHRSVHRTEAWEAKPALFNILKKLSIVLLVLVLLLVIDLYTFELILEDPGYYVVARRSDHPRQVLDALDRLQIDTLSRDKLSLLRNRYLEKSRNKDLSPDTKRLWTRAAKNTLKLLQKKK